MCLKALYLYKQNTQATQYIIATKEKVNCYLIWEHYFTKEELTKALEKQGFISLRFFEDVKGTAYQKKSETICVVAEKGKA